MKLSKKLTEYLLTVAVLVMFALASSAITTSAVSAPASTRVFEAEDAYLHFYYSTPNTNEGYSGNKYVGGGIYSRNQRESELTGAIDHNMSYIAFAVNAPADGNYSIAFRFKFGCKNNSQTEYDNFSKKFGFHPYTCIIVNGTASYRVYHPTNCGWISQSDYIQVNLKKGFNVIYAMTPPAEVSKEFDSVYVDYDYLIMDSALSKHTGELCIPGDCDNDGVVTLKDLIRLKSYISDRNTPINKGSANLNDDSNGYIDAFDLALMRKFVLKPSQHNELSYLKSAQLQEATTTIEAETYGITNRFCTFGDTYVGGMWKDSSFSQSYDSIISDGFFEKSQHPYVSYMVDVPQAGTYTLTSKYTIAFNEGVDPAQYYTLISVNDKYYYKDYFNPSPDNASINISKTQITLDKGVNVIRVVSAIADTYPMILWADMDYIQLNAAVTPIYQQRLHLNAGDSTYNGHYRNVTSKQLGGCDTSEARAHGVTYDNLTSDSLKYQPYFSYTIDVPADGYYDVDLHYNTGDESIRGQKGYFALLLDGQKSKIYYNNPSTLTEYNIANASLYLTKGTHTVAVTSCMLSCGVDPSYHDWADFAEIAFYGGISKSATQIRPYTKETYNCVLDIPLIGQSTNYTCNSASAAMLLNYKGYNISEMQFYNQAAENSKVYGGDPTYAYIIRYTINQYVGWTMYSEVYTGSMSFEQFTDRMKQSLEAGYGVEVLLQVPAGTEGFGYTVGGHYVVLSGIYENDDGEYIAVINDPWTKYGAGSGGQRIEIKLKTLYNLNRTYSGYVLAH